MLNAEFVETLDDPTVIEVEPIASSTHCDPKFRSVRDIFRYNCDFVARAPKLERQRQDTWSLEALSLRRIRLALAFEHRHELLNPTGPSDLANF